MAYPKLLLLLLFSTLLPPCTSHNLPPGPQPSKLQNGRDAKAQNPPPRPPPPGTSIKKGAPNQNEQQSGNEQIKALKGTLEYLQSVDKVEIFGQIASGLTTVSTLEALGKICSSIPIAGAVIGTIINIVLAFIPKKDPVLTSLRSGFKNIDARLTSMTKELKSETWRAMYSKYEINIKNGWDKLIEYIEVSSKVKTENDRMAEAKKFSKFYTQSNIEKNMLSLAQVLIVENDQAIAKNLVKVMVDQVKGNVLTLKLYNNYFLTLLFQGVVLSQVYHTIEKSNNDVLVRNTVDSLYKASLIMQKYEIECMEKYESYMRTDIENIAQAKANGGKALTKQESRELATKIRDALKEKYYWFDWGVVVYKTKAFRKHKFEGFTNLTKFDNANVAVARMKTGNRTTSNNTKTAVDSCIKAEQPCHKIVPLLSECSVQYAAVHVSPIESDSDNLKSPAEDESGSALPTEHLQFVHKGACTRSKLSPKSALFKGTFTIYMKSDHDINNFNPCAALQCAKGKGNCARLLDTDVAVCKCANGYYGELCENSFEDAVKPMKSSIEK